MAEEKINERLLEIYKNINTAHFEVKNIENAFNLKEDEEKKIEEQEKKVVEIENFISQKNQKILDDLPIIENGNTEEKKNVVEEKIENKDIESILNEIKTIDYFKELFSKKEENEEQGEKVEEEPNEKQMVYDEFERILRNSLDKKDKEINTLKAHYQKIIGEKDKFLVDKINSVMGIFEELKNNLIDKQKEIKNLNLEKIKMERLNKALMIEHNAISQLEEIELD